MDISVDASSELKSLFDKILFLSVEIELFVVESSDSTS